MSVPLKEVRDMRKELGEKLDALALKLDASTQQPQNTARTMMTAFRTGLFACIPLAIQIGAAAVTYTAPQRTSEQTVPWQGKNPESQAFFDNELEKIVTTRFKPDVAAGGIYVPRVQENEVKKRLHKTIGSRAGVFVLYGERGTGKSTLMQELLKREYKEGVLVVPLVLRADTRSYDEVRQRLEAVVLGKFGRCKDHCARPHTFVDFIRYANEVRERAMGEKAHPLIFYISLDRHSSTPDFSYKATVAVARAIRRVASALSTTIVDVSTGISDVLSMQEGIDRFRFFEVGAIPEDEFLQIGRQRLSVEDPQHLVEPYLKYLHDWLGGQTTPLHFEYRPWGESVGTKIEHATADTREEVLRMLKKGVDAAYDHACRAIRSMKEVTLLTKIAREGQDGYRYAPDDRIDELMQRDSDSTVLREVGLTYVRIRHYSHALCLHGVNGPSDPDVEQKIKEVKKKFTTNPLLNN